MKSVGFQLRRMAVRSESCRRSGLTLVELLIVLAIVAGLAGMIAVNYSNRVTVRGADGKDHTPEEVASLATMRAVREALVGTSTADPGYRGDIGNLPSRLGGLIENIDGEAPFDPVAKRGWRGPYLFHEGTRYGDFTETGDLFPTTPAALLDDPAILDGWGKPILLQGPDSDDARLVSAGPNRVLETDPDNPIDADRGDDRILFLFTADPNL